VRAANVCENRGMRRILLFAVPLALAVACTPRANIPDAERSRVEHELSGAQRYLRVAAYVAPFWGDRSKLLLTDQPPAELNYIETAGGVPIPPPSPDKVLPPGTAVRVRDVEFPTGWLIAKRVVMTPRYNPWVYVEGPESRPLVVVLSQTAASYDDVRAELGQILTTDDPSSLYRALPQEQRDAVLRKDLVEGMAPRTVEMAWGIPERKRIDRPAATEEWSWSEGKRKAFFRDERLVRWEK
jgi:hypothetical protein